MHAYCKIFKSDIHSGSIGIGALESHRKGKKHTLRQTNFPTANLHNCLGSSIQQKSSTIINTTPTSSQETRDSVEKTSKIINTVQEFKLTTLATSENVLKAEIFWTLYTVINHNSNNSNATIRELVKSMFIDSEIAKQFTCGKTKAAYLLTFGLTLAPYYSR